MISEIIILHKPEQIDAIISKFGIERLLRQEDFCIFALDCEVEMVLRQRNIPYQSLQEYLSPDSFSDLPKNSAQYIRRWCDAPEMTFFRHREMGLGEILKQRVLHCVKETLYYLEVFNLILNAHSNIRRLWIPNLNSSTLTTYSLNRFVSQIPIEVGKLLGDSRGIVVSGVPYASHHRQQQTLVKIRKRLASPIRRALLHLINFAITVTRPPQKLKLLVVDKWSNIEPFISKMNNVELVMMQPEEIRKAKWQAWKKRIRFYYPNDFLTSDIKKTAKAKQSQFLAQWRVLGDKPKFSEIFHYKQVSFWPILKQLFDDVIITDWSERIICQIECINRLFSRFSFDWVLLQGTSKPKYHITAKLARPHNVQTIELQHATILYAENIIDCYVPTDYFAAYGKLTTEFFADHPQNTSRHIIEIGSPRFDKYVLQRGQENQNLKRFKNDLEIDSSRLVILLSAPPIFGPLDACYYFTGHDLVKLFQTLTRLQQGTSRPRVIVKLRVHSNIREFCRTAAQEYLPSDTIIAQHEDLESLLRLSDIVVSYKSTSALEAMIIGKPVVLFAINEEPSWFKLLEEAGALRIARTHEEVFEQVYSLVLDKEARQKLVENANAFLQKHYRFDGKSSDRIKELLEGNRSL